MGGMSNKVRVADDYELWLRFSLKYQFYYLPEYLAYYRVMKHQISSDKKDRFKANEKIILDFLDKYPSSVTSTEARKGLGIFYARKARYHASIVEKKTAIQSIVKALTYFPEGLIIWRAFFRVLFPKTLSTNGS
jgi:hypothetical protein